MKTKDPAIDDIRKIRMKMYEETKGMTRAEIIAYIREGAEQAEKYQFEKFGVKMKKVYSSEEPVML